MKQIFTLFCLTLSTCAFSQVKIGSPGAPNASAVLELDGGTGKGLLLPRLTQQQRTDMTNVPQGLMIFQTDGTSGLYYNRSAAPAIPNWAFASEGANHWATSTANNIVNYNSGFVGIGTGFFSTPAMKFHVENNDSNIAVFSNSQTLAVNTKAGIFLRTGNILQGSYYTGAIKSIGTASNSARLGLFTYGSTDVNSLKERLSISDAGYVGIGDTTPTLAGLVVDKKAGAVNALFGSNTTGVAIESSYPGIAFNSYYNNGRKVINTGYGSLIGQDPSTGRFYISTSAASVSGQGTTMNTIDRLNINPDGNIGVQGNTDPQAPLSFAASLGKKISLYRGNTGDAGFGVFANELRINSDYNGADITFGYDNLTNGFTERMRVKASGQVCIGTNAPASGYLLSVNGKVIAEEVRVQLKGAWPDYVFSKNYKLLSLNEVENYISENNHLPNVPAAADVDKSGIALGEMQTRMMEKIEELTLYIIALKKEIDVLKSKTSK